MTSPAPEGGIERAKLRADGCSGHVVLVQYKTVSVPAVQYSWFRQYTMVG